MSVDPEAPVKTGTVNRYGFAYPTHCAKCGGVLIYLTNQWVFNDARKLVRCGGMDDKCENRWPWLQDGNIGTRVSPTVKGLLDTDESLGEQWDALRRTISVITMSQTERDDIQARMDSMQAWRTAIMAQIMREYGVTA